MARRQQFLDVEFSERFRERYAVLSQSRQNGVDKVIIVLIKQQVTPGMRVKPILPEKYYNEARVNDGDRLIYRVAEGTILIMDVVSHDDIAGYGKR